MFMEDWVRQDSSLMGSEGTYIHEYTCLPKEERKKAIIGSLRGLKESTVHDIICAIGTCATKCFSIRDL